MRKDKRIPSIPWSDRRFGLLVIASTAPLAVLAFGAVAYLVDERLLIRQHTLFAVGTALVVVVALWLWSIAHLWRIVIWPLRTLSNGIAAIRQHDYAIRLKRNNPSDALGLAFVELNLLAETLMDERTRAVEAQALVATVLEEIDVAVFAFDSGTHMRFVNRRAELLLGRTTGELTLCAASELGLGFCLEGPPDRTMTIPLDGGSSRWRVRRSSFRQDGLPHQLVTLSDVGSTLRAEEQSAWQRLVRVLGHEINNSLGPIRSIADTLASLLARTSRPLDWEEDATAGLEVIRDRATGLSRFLESYSLLARLPRPLPTVVRIGDVISHVVRLEQRVAIEVRGDPELQVRVDSDQLQHLLINLVRNACDALAAAPGHIQVDWQRHNTDLDLTVTDSGSGVANMANLFVPFFTTKGTGSGIGLALSRQIAENHGGTLTLANRADSPGAIARLLIPNAVVNV